MKLADLRKHSIRQQIRIRFGMRNGMECVVTEHGLAQVPGLHTVPDFNLEQELATASDFVLEPVAPPSGRKGGPTARRVGRDELDSMLASATHGSAAAEHDEE